MSDPQLKPKSQFVPIPDWEEYPPALRPFAKGIFFLIFPLIACLQVWAYLMVGGLYLIWALLFLASVVAAGPAVMLIVVLITVVAARWTFGRAQQKPPESIRGRTVQQRSSPTSTPSGHRGRSIVRRTHNNTSSQARKPQS